MTREESEDAQITAERIEAMDAADFAEWVEAQYQAYLATEGMCEPMQEAA
jgi:hypothetical protein